MAAASSGRRLRTRARSSDGTGAFGRLAWVLTALGSATAAAGVVVAQPYAPWLIAPIGVVLAILGFVHPAWGVALALGVLPVADFTDHTGMIFLAESDLVLLAAVAGAALRLGVRPLPVVDPGRPPAGVYAIAMIGVGLAGALALAFSLAPLPPVGWEALSGYTSPINGLRLAKAFLLAVLLLAVTRACLRTQASDTIAAVRAGVVASVGLVGLAVTWERVAFAGLTEFAADYRATGPFWEMHVGGAALDGWLAMTFPMVVWGLVTSRRVVVSVVLAVVAAVGMYALLATFSRGLYAAVAVEAVIMTVWATRGGAFSQGRTGLTLRRGLVAALALAVLGFAAFSIFASSGYRGLAAFLGVAWLAFVAAPRVAEVSPGVAVGGVALGALLGGAIGFVGAILPKGPYVLYGAVAGLTASLLWLADRRQQAYFRGLALASLVATALAAPFVAVHWGGDGAAGAAWLGVGLAMSLVPLCQATRPPLWGRQVTVALAGGVALAGAGVIAVLGNSYYANVRFSTAGSDLSSRGGHWSDGLSLVQSPAEWLGGIGPGRFAERFAWRTRDRFLPGQFRVVPDAVGHHMVLTGPNLPVGWGEIFRVSQRIGSEPQLPLTAEVTARLPADVTPGIPLHFDVCRKHLLYDAGCVAAGIALPAGLSTQRIVLGGATSLGEARALGWPRATRFALGLDSVGGRAEILSIRLMDADGRDLLRNGDFRAGAAWWFFSSDRSHLAYHAKNLWLQVLLEQGLPGLLAVAAAGLLALAWTIVGPGHRHPLAPPLATGLIGFGIVGVFDSLVDAARIATLCLVMLGLALSLRAKAPGSAVSQ